SCLFGFMVISTGSLLAVCAGLLARMGEPAPDAEDEAAIPSGGWRLWATPAVVITAAIAAYLLVAEPLMANYCCRRGDLALVEAPAEAVSCYEQAAKFDPGSDVYCVRLADASHRDAMRTNSANATRR